MITCHGGGCFKRSRNIGTLVLHSALPMKLLYGNEYWENILGQDVRQMPLERRLHLVLSLVIFLQISVAKLLYCVFTSTVDEVKTRSSRFMGYTPSARTEDLKFPPGMVFRAWLENLPDAEEPAQYDRTVCSNDCDYLACLYAQSCNKCLTTHSWTVLQNWWHQAPVPV